MVPRLEPLGWRVVIAELAGTHERSFCAGAGDVPSCFIGALERLRPVLQSLSRGLRFSNRWREDSGSPIAGARTDEHFPIARDRDRKLNTTASASWLAPCRGISPACGRRHAATPADPIHRKILVLCYLCCYAILSSRCIPAPQLGPKEPEQPAQCERSRVRSTYAFRSRGQSNERRSAFDCSIPDKRYCCARRN